MNTPAHFTAAAQALTTAGAELTGVAAELQANQHLLAPANMQQLNDNVGAMQNDIVALQNTLLGVQNDTVALRDTLLGVQNTMAAMQNTMVAMQNTLVAVQGSIVIVQNDLAALRGDFNALRDIVVLESQLRPLRQFNQGCSDLAALMYPANYDPDNIADDLETPAHKLALRSLRVQDCVAVAEELGLPLLGQNAPVRERRLQISDYLGCGMAF